MPPSGASSAPALGTSSPTPSAIRSTPTPSPGWIRPYLDNIKFHEHFYTTAVQPYAEFQWVSIPDLTVTAGVKDAFFRMNLTQYADGHTVGPLTCPAGAATLAANCTATTQHSQNYNSILPSIEANYRLNPIASVYRSVRPRQHRSLQHRLRHHRR